MIYHRACDFCVYSIEGYKRTARVGFWFPTATLLPFDYVLHRF
jgi:hypothetical protein